MDRRIQRILIIAAYGLGLTYAVYIRVKVMPDYFGNPYLNIVDCDIARFLRLIDLIAHRYPSLPLFDSFANFPWGMKEQLPPVWAFIEASFALLVRQMWQVPLFSAAAVFPIVVGLLIAVPSYYVGRRLFGKWAGHAAVFLSLFQPLMAAKTFLGAVDHHAADLLLYMSLMAFLVGSYWHHSTGNKRRAMLLSILAGLTLTSALLVSLSSILLVAILAVTIFLAFLFLSEEEKQFGFQITSLTLLVSGLSMLSLFFVTPWFERLSFSGLSLFQPVLLLGLTFMILIVRALDRFLVNRNVRGRVLILLFIYMSCVAAILIVPGVGQQLIRGFYRSIGYYPLSKVVTEWRPLFEDVPRRALAVLVALLIGFLVWFRHIPLRHEFEFWRLLFLVWIGVTTFYFVNAAYYAFVTLPAIVISFAVVMACPPRESLGENAEGEMRMRKGPILVIWSIAPITMAILFLLWPSRVGRLDSDVAQTQMLKWIKQGTPAVSHYYEPNRVPEYGIVAPWYIGEMIETISERPVLATGDHERGIRGIITSYRIFQAKSEADAVSIMRKHRLKYILLQQKYVVRPWMGDIEGIGEPSPNPDEIARVATRAEVPQRDYLRLLNVRLDRFWGGASEKNGIEALQHFRLVKVTGRGKKTYKLFELVKGARLVVRAERGTKATVSTIIQAGEQRIKWKVSHQADRQGKIEVFLPYATKNNRYPVSADPYQVAIGEKTLSLDVREDSVLSGESLHLP